LKSDWFLFLVFVARKKFRFFLFIGQT
jgi:hypothetical protein